MSNITYVNEELLGSVVQGYPVIYDKTCKDFYRKEVKLEAWAQIARKVNLDTGEHVQMKIVCCYIFIFIISLTVVFLAVVRTFLSCDYACLLYTSPSPRDS